MNFSIEELSEFEVFDMLSVKVSLYQCPNLE